MNLSNRFIYYEFGKVVVPMVGYNHLPFYFKP